MTTPIVQHAAQQLTISALNKQVKQLLEAEINEVCVVGEISNLKLAHSGHLYFSLKDSQCQVSCAMFRGYRQQLSFEPADGLSVVATAIVTLYEPRGNYQLIVKHLTAHGEGALQHAYEILKKKLHQEGLFAAHAKQSLPDFCVSIAVITSAQGAAIRDVLHVLARRFPIAEVLIYPSLVQGRTAHKKLIECLRKADRQQHDVILLVRGGGSLEDLFAFNHEALARTLFACKTPVVTGIGHEIDLTIADLVADASAPTPSAAAEIVSPDLDWWMKQLQQYDAQLLRWIQQQIASRKKELHYLCKRHRHPQQQLFQSAQRFDELEMRMLKTITRKLEQCARRLNDIRARLTPQSIYRIMSQTTQQLQLQETRRRRVIYEKIIKCQSELTRMECALNHLNPMTTLSRGYALVKQENRLIASVHAIQPGKTLRIILSDGEIDAHIDQIKEGIV